MPWEMGVTCGTCGGEEKRILGFEGYPDGRRTLAIPRRRCQHSVKVDLEEIGLDSLNWAYVGGELASQE
jgi:hypothetical protein